MRVDRNIMLLSLALVLGQLISFAKADVMPNSRPAATSAQVLITNYLGCYIDQSVRDLNGVMTTFDRNNTVEACANFCWRRNFQYSGVQFS